MIKAIVLMHPQSTDYLSDINIFKSKKVTPIRISCGVTKSDMADLSESSDFFPTYASWNSALFESSMILTVWEHADNLIGDNNVVFIHTDIKPHFKNHVIWNKIDRYLTQNPDSSLGLTAPVACRGLWNSWEIPNASFLNPVNDPYYLHCFDNNVFVWDIIKKYDSVLYDWAFDTKPQMIYSHQFGCSRSTLDYLGLKLFEISRKMKLEDLGFWTPHVYERLIALYLAYKGPPLLTTAFWHYQSSGVQGPGHHALYGPRPVRYYNVKRKYDAMIES